MMSKLRKIFVIAATLSCSFLMAQTTYYSKSTATNFNDVSSWGINTDGSGTAPASITGADFYIIQNAAVLTVSGPVSVGKLTLTSGSLNVSANELSVAISGQNNSTLLVNGGTLNLSGTGSIIVNGNFLMSSGTFNQTGGSMTIDGNNGNVVASSVASGTHHFAMTGGTPNCSAGTITIVDPPVNTYAVSSSRAISISLTANTTGFSGTHTFVLGDGVSSTPGSTDGFTIETYASSIVYINNVIVNAGSASGRWGSGSYGTSTSWGTYIKGSLTINSGSEFRVNQTITSANNLVVGSVVNNGIFTTGRATGSPTVFIGSHATATWNPTAASLISGTGIFRNLASAPTAAFTMLTIVNPLGVTFAPGTLTLGTYAGHVSGTLTLIAGAINTNSQEFVLGIGTGALGTLTYTAGGFTSGTTFSRWWAAATAGTTITASTAPAVGTGTYPFVSGINNRSFHINRPTTTGAVGGIIKVQYADAMGMSAIPAVLDGTYSVDRQSNANWTVSTGSTFAAGTGNFSYAINGQGVYVPLNANGRLIKNSSFTGTHQAGTNLPIVQRTGITAANFMGTYNVGIGASDVPLQSVQSGAFEDPATWGGTAPTCSSTCAVMSSHTVTVSSSTAGSCAGLIIALNGTLAVNGGALTIGCANNNSTLSNSGTLNVSGGLLTLNGNLANLAGSTFVQTGGDIIVDGNNGNVTASSVASGTALVSYASNAITLTGGKLTIVDPHAGVATETAIAYTPSTAPYPVVTTGHTVQFGDGVSTTSGGSLSGFRVTQGTRLALGNVVVNTLSGRYVYASANLPIYGDLSINNGEFQIQSGNIGLVAGNIINNGTLTTIGTLYLGTYTPPSTLAPSTAAQSISGTGIFRNLATSPTANFTSLTINNTNSAGVTFSNSNSLASGANTGTVSGTLTITAGLVNTAGNTFVLGTAVGTLGTMTVTSGGFSSGSVLSRWFPTATGGTSIIAGTAPSLSTAGSFPFVTSGGVTRAFFVQQTTAPTLGGRINIAYNGSVGGTTPASFADGTYNIETRSNENWTVTQTGITGTPVYSFALSAQNLYGAINGNSRITLASAPATGSHQLGSALPNAQRIGIALSALADTYYIGVANADVPFQAISSGNWDDGTTWNKGIAPSCSDIVIIPSGNTVTVNATAVSCQNLTISSGGTLVVAGSSLTTGCSLNNNTLSNSGTLSVSGGTLFINGNLNCLAGSTFNQSGGEILIDGNGGTGGTNVASGVSLCQLSSQLINWTGGTLTIVDPHANATASESFTYTNSTAHVNVTAGHTIRFGDGISTDPGGNATNGFRINTWPGSNRISLFNFEVNTLGGTNRHISTTYSFGINGSLNIISGEFRDNATTVYVAQNLINNGTYVGTGTLSLASYQSGTVAPASQPQAISGAGIFSNNVTIASKTADLANLTINNTNAGGLLIDRSLSVSGTLTMTNGISSINAPYVLQLGTTSAAGTLSGTPSATNMLRGIFARTFASTRTATGTYSNATLYPLGSGSAYLPIFIDPTTGSSGASTISASAFDSNTGTGGNGVTGVANVRWEYSSTAANLNSAFIRVAHIGIVSGKVFLQSPTSAGVYDPIPSVISTVSGTNLTSGAVPVSAMTGILSYGDLIPCYAPIDQATTWTTTVLSTTSLSATLTAAPSAPTGYLVVRYPVGSTPVNPVDFTSYVVGATIGTGTVAYYGTSLSFTVSGLVAGASYDFYVYSFNAGSCAGPVYNISGPLLSNVTTCATATNAPVSSAGTLITNSSFQANWTVSTSAGVTDQFLEVSTSSTFATFVAGYPLNVGPTANSYPVIGLNGNTTYYYRVRAAVGLCSSAYSTNQTVLTDCSAITALPHTQNFATFLPSCWKNQGQGGTPATGPTVTTTGSWAADGFLNNGTTGAVKVNLYTNTKKSWLISPSFDLSTGTYVLRYNVALTVWNGTTAATLGSDDEVQVLISVDGGLSWTNLKTYNASTAISNLGTQELIDISAYNSNNVKIAFWANEGSVDDTPDNDFFIDDFMIDNAPTCYKAVSLTASNVTPVSADFSWSPPLSGTTPVGYNWEIRTSGAGGSGPAGLVDFGTTTNTFATSTTGILQPNTAYFIYVQTDCGSGFSSSWTGPLAVATPCQPIATLPWTEGFEGIATVGANAFPTCWKKENGDWQSATAATNTYNDPRTGTKYITETYSATNEWIWTPPFDLVAGTAYNFNFWFAGDGLTGWTGEVGYNTIQSSTGATILGTPFITSATTSVTSYQQVSNLFIAPTSGTYYFGIRINANSTPWYLGFDDFSLELAPTCFPATGLVASNITSSTVDFSWNAPAGGNPPLGYNYEIRTSGLPGSGLVGLKDSGNTQNTFVSIAPGTLNDDKKYSIYVQVDCGNGNTSSWFGPVDFRTLCASITTLPWTEGFEGLTSVGANIYPSCWKKQNGDWQSATAATNTYNDPRTGTYYLTETYSATNEWIWTPSFRLNAGSSYKFSFWFAGDGYSGWICDVGVSSTQNSTGATIMGAPFVTAATTTSNLYQNVAQTFSPVTTGDYFFGIRINASSVPWYLGFDDFSLEELPACTSAPAPAMVSISSSSVCAGSSVVLNAAGLNTTNSGISYQWQYSDDNGVTWYDLQGAVSGSGTSAVTITNVSIPTLYRLNGICFAGGTSTSNQVGVSIATVSGGTTLASANSVCSSTTTANTTLSLSGATAGVTYQWQSSANGSVFTDIAGATSATYAATVSSTTYFQCVVTCGGSSATSTPVMIDLNPANQCYCIPLHSGSSCISNVSIGAINNNSPTCVSPYYSSQSATTDLKRGTIYNLTVTTVDAAILSVWIDYNQNGVFEASEWNQITTASVAGVPTIKSITIPSTALLGKTGMRIRSRSTGSANGAGDACTQFFSGECEDYFVTITDPFPTMAAKVFLGNVNPQTGLMNDYLRTMFNFPISDPYSTSPLNLSFVHVNNGTNPATISPQVLNVSGNNAIVDWVFLELRNGPSGATSVQYTRSALLQADGDIVDTDGTSRVAFPNAVVGDYYVAVRHRNHIGFRTSNTISVNSGTPLLDFTNNSVPLNGAYPLTAVGPTVSAMNSGDSNSDGSIDSIDSIYWETQNGLFDDYLLNAEYNLDGSVDSIDTIVWETNNGKYQELD